MRTPMYYSVATALASAFLVTAAAQAQSKAINLNGASLVVDGKSYQAESVAGVVTNAQRFTATSATLSPVASAEQTSLIYSSLYKSSGTLTMSVPLTNGDYDIYLHTWEDNNNVSYNLILEGQTVASGLSSGTAGQWRRLGPYRVTMSDGTLDMSSTGGVNFSSFEAVLVSQTTPTPEPTPNPEPIPSPVTNPPPSAVTVYNTSIYVANKTPSAGATVNIKNSVKPTQALSDMTATMQIRPVLATGSLGTAIVQHVVTGISLQANVGHAFDLNYTIPATTPSGNYRFTVLLQNSAKTQTYLSVTAGSALNSLVVSGSTTTPTPEPTPNPEPTPTPTPSPSTGKPKLIVTTDAHTSEPDDKQSLFRLLSYSNEFDIKAIVMTTAEYSRNKLYPEIVHDVINKYEVVRPNFVVHGGSSYPTAAYLRGLVKNHLPVYGMNGVGAGKDTEGSNLIISVVDASSEPVNVVMWGGSNALAQALYQVKTTRTQAQVDQFVAKLKVYAITRQDDSSVRYIEPNFPNLFYIISLTAWRGIAGEKHFNFPGPDFKLVSDNKDGYAGGYWIPYNIRIHGTFGAAYPAATYMTEGDSPSFMHFLPTGLNDPHDPTQGGWGGRFTQKAGTNHYFEASDTVAGQGVYAGTNYTQPMASVWRYRADFQNDFAARMKWSATANYASANHAPIVVVTGSLNRTVNAGEVISLNAAGTTDPDGDNLNYTWYQYKEAGTYSGEIQLTGSGLQQASFVAPNVSSPVKIHVILKVTDTDTHPMTDTNA